MSPASAETVAKAIDGYLRVSDRTKPAELAFYGGSFTAIPPQEQESLLRAALPFLRFHPDNTLRVSTRPDCVDEASIARLKQYRVTTVELGCQSFCDDVLAKSGRGHTAEDSEKAARLLKSAGFSVILQMMTGLPGDDREKSLYTARRISALRPDGVRIYPTVILRDTPLYDLWKTGRYTEHTVEQAVSICAELYSFFRLENIPVIRVGLNPSRELSGGEAAGGAYHPAFGQLVLSRWYLEQICSDLSGRYDGKTLAITAPKGRASIVAGQRRENTMLLQSKYGFSKIAIREADIPEGEIRTAVIDSCG